MHDYDEDNDGRYPGESPVEVRYPPQQAGSTGRPRAVVMAYLGRL